MLLFVDGPWDDSALRQMIRGMFPSLRGGTIPPKRRRLRYETLEGRMLLAAEPVITEFMASNRSTLVDGDGDSSDWVEIHNEGDEPINLQGWHLSDDSANPTKWVFPSVEIGVGGYLVVFASGKNTTDQAGHLHTSFKLAQDGEYLGLIHSDGTTVISDFSPSFPVQLTDVSYGALTDGSVGYFDVPTPGAPNPPEFSLGPSISGVDHSPHEPAMPDPLVVTATVLQTIHPVDSVSLVYRVMYKDEVTVPMTDDGSGHDQLAGDGVYTGMVPEGVATTGQMLRYYVVASDVAGNIMRAPRIVDTTGNDQSPEYFGTVIDDPSMTTELPLFQWFTDDVAGARSRPGARASVFYDGEFYDNVFVRQRGAFTNAQSQKFEFDSGHRFRVSDSLGRVKEINVNAEGDDTSYVRQTLAYQTNQLAGSPSSESFLMQMKLNGRSDRVGIFIEQVDEDFLSGNGFDPVGALYKFVQRENNVSREPALADILTGVEKKTRQTENTADLEMLVEGLNLAAGQERKTFVFDNLNLPNVINYLAVRAITAEADDNAKNFYLHRDTNGNREWSIFPWDKDRTFGLPEDPLTNQLFLGHPFNGQGGNRLYNAIFSEPETREMYLRRLRTLMDEWLNPPDTPSVEAYFENRVDELFAPVAAFLGNEAAAALDRMKTDFFPPLRTDLYARHSIDRRTDLDSIVTIIPEFADGARYFVPVDDTLGDSWIGLEDPPNIGQWGTGQTGIGFENEPENFRDLIKTSVKPLDACATCTSTLIRIPFSVENISNITDLTLRMKYDDGFIAYINGVEVARRNVTGEATFDTRAAGHLDSEAVVFENILISEHIGLLNHEENVLAIHGLNISPRNSDMLILPELVSGAFGDDTAAGIPHAQAANPEIQFGAFEHNPISGNQDEEFIELFNPNETAVDISGWRLEGGIQHTFLPGTVIAAGGTMYVSPDAEAFRNRAASPTGGMGLFVQGGYQGHLSNFGETVQLMAADGGLMDTLQTPFIPTPAQLYLRVSEVHFNPPGPDDLTEFVELTNISHGADAITLDLAGVSIVHGPSEPFTFPDGISLAPGARTVVLKNVAEFTAAYPNVDTNIIAGEFQGNLANGGERIKVDDAEGSTIVDFEYGDRDPWPAVADGVGATLELIAPLSTSSEEYSKYYHWRASTPFGGTPGAAESNPIGVVINEVLSRTDDPNGPGDAVELHNTTGSAIDIGGWYLSDAASDLLKFQIPAGTSLPADGYLVFDESNFNAVGAQKGFAFDSVEGDEVYLVISNEAGDAVDSIVDSVHFGAAKDGETFGRVPNGTGRLAPLASNSLGDANGGPRVGPFVFTELSYNPGTPSPAALSEYPLITSDDLEFLEVHNPSADPIDLTNWKVRGGVDFNFEEGTMVASGETVLVIPFNPNRPENALRLAAFRAHYNISGAVRLLGGYGGTLSNGGERLQLQRPDAPPIDQPDFIPGLYEDEVLYDDLSPWPAADGTGNSLNRIGATAYGNDASSWLGNAPTPGQVDFTRVPGDLSGDGVVDIRDIDYLCGAIHGPFNANADLNTDGMLDLDDIATLVTGVLRTAMGDSNLDGQVNAADLNKVGLRWQQSGASWATGDFTCDGNVTVADLNLIGVNWLFGATPHAARVPRAPLVAAVAMVPKVTDQAVIELVEESPIMMIADMADQPNSSARHGKRNHAYARRSPQHNRSQELNDVHAILIDRLIATLPVFH